MLIHNTIIYKARFNKFYMDHDPECDKEYNDWIRSLPGVISVTNEILTDIKMERIIEFTDTAAYENWLVERKKQESWKKRRKYERKNGIMSISKRHEI